MNLKPQDIVILLKLAVWSESKEGIWFVDSKITPPWTYQSLANELFISPSEMHAGVKRAAAAGLMNLKKRAPIIKALEEFLIHGVKYAFPPRRGGITRGLATSYAGPPLENIFIYSDEPPPVWPYSEGPTRGLEFSPLYKNVPRAAVLDVRLYEMLALVDAIRDGRARESALAIKELKSRLGTR